MASLSVYKIKHVRESFKVLECQIEGHLTETTVYHLDFSIWISLARRRLRQVNIIWAHLLTSTPLI
jgi:hypothetical protein